MNFLKNGILRHRHRNFERIYISATHVHKLPRLCTPNVNRSNKRKRFPTKKVHEVDGILHKL